ncbi:MAG: oligosaccharide repeat unit polymerase [Arcobacter sp.]|nr:oligosaccharide repeat unit polymerase [Arcobacter sp.]
MNILTISIVLTTMIVFFLNNGLKNTLLHPFFYICFYYIFFFHTQTQRDPDFALDVDFAVMLSFIFFTLSFFTIFSFVKNRFVDRQLKRFFPFKKIGDFTDVLSSNKTRTIIISSIFFIVVIWTFFFFDLALKEYGSIETVFLQFYSTPLYEYPFYHKIIFTLLPLMLMFIFVLRIFVHYYQSRFAYIVTIVAILLVSLCLFTIGTRGYFLTMLILLILADLIYVFIEKTRIRITLFTKISAIFLFFMMIVLTSIRGQYHAEYSDLFSSIQNSISGETVEKFSRGGSIPDEVAFSLKHYGNDLDFLGGHTYYSILVNPIPRVFWPEKPVGFGRILAWDQGFHHSTNVSLAAGIAGEGYAGFGWSGVIVLSLIMGMYSGFMAKVAWRCFHYRNFVVLIIGLLFFSASISIVRGDMLSGITMNIYTIILFLMLLYIRKVFLVSIKRKT